MVMNLIGIQKGMNEINTDIAKLQASNKKETFWDNLRQLNNSLVILQGSVLRILNRENPSVRERGLLDKFKHEVDVFVNEVGYCFVSNAQYKSYDDATKRKDVVEKLQVCHDKVKTGFAMIEAANI